jgi:hypothetical protein
MLSTYYVLNDSYRYSHYYVLNDFEAGGWCVKAGTQEDEDLV